MRFLMTLTILAVLFTPSCVTWVSKSTEQGSVTGVMTPEQAAALETTDAQADAKRQQARSTEIAVRKGQSITVDEDARGSHVTSGRAAEYEALPFGAYGFGAYGMPMAGNPYGNPGIDRARAQAALDNPRYGPAAPRGMPPSAEPIENDPLTAAELKRQKARLERLENDQEDDEQAIDDLYGRHLP